VLVCVALFAMPPFCHVVRALFPQIMLAIAVGAS
jgi:hypothetical protein